MRKISFSIIILLIIGVFSGKSYAQCGGWRAPKLTNGYVNPLLNDNSSIVKGEKIYTQMCVICHGIDGEGDGISGVSLRPRPANLSSNKTQMQTDGAIFWKISNGKGAMTAYQELLTESQRWEVINYIRTFK